MVKINKGETNLNEVIGDNRSMLMGFAIISVIAYHLAFRVHPEIPIFKGLVYYGWIGVEIFMFVSGWGLYHSLQKSGNLVAFYRRRLKRIFPAYLLVNVAFAFVEKISLWDFILRFTTIGYWAGVAQFDWYIPCIVLFYILSPFLFKWLQVQRWLFVVVCMVLPYAVAVVLVSCFGVYDWHLLLFSLTRLPVFCLGLLVAKADISFSMFAYKVLLVAAIVLMGALFIALQDKHVSLQVMRIVAFFLTIPLCLTVVLILNVLHCDLLCRLLKAGGIVSLELYLLHEHIFKDVTMAFDFWNVSFILFCIICLAQTLHLAANWLTSKLNL